MQIPTLISVPEYTNYFYIFFTDRTRSEIKINLPTKILTKVYKPSLDKVYYYPNVKMMVAKILLRYYVDPCMSKTKSEFIHKDVCFN